VDAKSAYMFFHDFLGAPNGMLMLNLMQTAGAATDIIISVVPTRIEADKIAFAVWITTCIQIRIGSSGHPIESSPGLGGMTLGRLAAL
jgi:hypothetical protein